MRGWASLFRTPVGIPRLPLEYSEYPTKPLGKPKYPASTLSTPSPPDHPRRESGNAPPSVLTKTSLKEVVPL